MKCLDFKLKNARGLRPTLVPGALAPYRENPVGPSREGLGVLGGESVDSRAGAAKSLVIRDDSGIIGGAPKSSSRGRVVPPPVRRTADSRSGGNSCVKQGRWNVSAPGLQEHGPRG
jgi:hypothetical protein